MSYGQKTRPRRCPEPELIALRTLMLISGPGGLLLEEIPSILNIGADRQPHVPSSGRWEIGPVRNPIKAGSVIRVVSVFGNIRPVVALRQRASDSGSIPPAPHLSQNHKL
jgi:hypothetical protein